MRKSKISAKLFKPGKEDIILLDTNILINLFYPIDFESTDDILNNLYNEIKLAKSNLIISSIQLSEFINRCIRLQFNLYKKLKSDTCINFKNDYRSTQDYRVKMNGILDIIESDIITSFNFVDDCFSKMDTKRIFIRGFSYDFNDSLIVEIVRKYNAILITNDKDFINYGSDINIVTSNNFLLNCR